MTTYSAYGPTPAPGGQLHYAGYADNAVPLQGPPGPAGPPGTSIDTTSLPTSPAGLAAGTVWRNGDFLCVV